MTDTLMKLLPPLPHGLRGPDAYGSGEWHASRDSGNRLHQGLDFKAERVGEDVVFPADCMTEWFGYAYPGDDFYCSVHLSVDGNPHLKIVMFYVRPMDERAGETHLRGDTLGIVQDLRLRYPADFTHKSPITLHVHVQISLNGVLTDPTPYFFPPLEVA